MGIRYFEHCFDFIIDTQNTEWILVAIQYANSAQ